MDLCCFFFSSGEYWQRALPGGKEKAAESVPDAVETADPAGDKGIFLKTYGNVLVLEELLC